MEFKPTDRFLPISVYRFPLGSCGGITDLLETIYIPCPTGSYTFEEVEDHLIFYEEKRGEEYWALKPYQEPKGMIGPMAGGNLAYCSDSRCKRVYHIHDRFETEEQYNSNSN
jgi:hypothetical protein